MKALVEEARREGKSVDGAIDEAAISARLYTAGMPDPDLLIRTSGEMRVSNFLLWQIAYAELYVTETLWPDFTRAELLEAILDYQRRDRRFGGLGTGGALQRRAMKRIGTGAMKRVATRAGLIPSGGLWPGARTGFSRRSRRRWAWRRFTNSTRLRACRELRAPVGRAWRRD